MLDFDSLPNIKITSQKIIDSRRSKLEQDLDDYLLNGGEIKVLKPGESGEITDKETKEALRNKAKKAPDFEAIAKSAALERIKNTPIISAQASIVDEREEMIRQAAERALKRKKHHEAELNRLEEKRLKAEKSLKVKQAEKTHRKDIKLRTLKSKKTKYQSEEERIENTLRVRELKRLKNEALEKSLKFFQGPCKIHGMTTYGIFHNGTRCCLCKSNQRVSLTLKNTNNEYYMEDRLRREKNRDLMYLAIMQCQFTFIGSCMNCGDTTFKAVMRRPTGRRHAYYYHCISCNDTKNKLSKSEKEKRRTQVALELKHQASGLSILK